jgi:hypothetical protein
MDLPGLSRHSPAQLPIIAVASGKGGVGKSSVAVAIARRAASADASHAVCIFDLTRWTREMSRPDPIIPSKGMRAAAMIGMALPRPSTASLTNGLQLTKSASTARLMNAFIVRCPGRPPRSHVIRPTRVRVSQTHMVSECLRERCQACRRIMDIRFSRCEP